MKERMKEERWGKEWKKREEGRNKRRKRSRVWDIKVSINRVGREKERRVIERWRENEFLWLLLPFRERRLDALWTPFGNASSLWRRSFCINNVLFSFSFFFFFFKETLIELFLFLLLFSFSLHTRRSTYRIAPVKFIPLSLSFILIVITSRHLHYLKNHY